MNQAPYPYMPFNPMEIMQGNIHQNFSGNSTQNYDLINRIERLERQIKRLETRVYHLEDKNNDEYTSLSKEYIKDDDGLYMV